MSKPVTGGSAFPVQGLKTYDGMPVKGLSKREYFAAAALNGLLSDPDARGTEQAYARDAVALADALLAALAKGGGDE